MKKNSFLFLIFAFAISFSTFSQRGKFVSQDGNFRNMNQNDSLNNSSEIDVKLSGKTKYTDYKIISYQRDTTYIDTTLTIKKEYKFNFLRKDNFELLEFHNQGQTFTSLGYSFDNLKQFPDIGYTAKQFGFLNIDDINYYEVPTPTTEILYRTGLQQGQVLDALFTLNFSKRFNVSMAYKGIRSLGAYRRSLASQGNLRATFQYRTKENQYEIRGHIVRQEFFNEESGGLNEEMLANFTDKNPEFENRARLDVNLLDAENNLEGDRIYLEHSYKLLASKDTVNSKDFSNLKIGHIYTSEEKFYNFSQTTTTAEIFGEENATSYGNKDANYEMTNNEINVEFNSKYVLGKFKAKATLSNYSYGYDSILNSKSSISKNKLQGKSISFGANWKAKINNFQLHGDASVTPGAGRLSGNFLKGEALFEKDSLFSLKGSLLISSKSANFNTLLHQSNYDNYNWENNFSNVNTRDLGFSFSSKWVNASLNFTNIDNYTYFDENNTPQQFSNQITYLKVKANREFSYGKFALDNTFMYQNVSSGSSVFRVPELVTRNTVYYSDYWFKGKPMQVQIGATFKYFTTYKANAYNPILAEFTLQNTTDIGYPTIDVFFNAQIRRTRLYLKVDNVTSDYTTKNYFSAPNYPYRDFTVRFGLVWNWFI